jgi:hypothetical protein
MNRHGSPSLLHCFNVLLGHWEKDKKHGRGSRKTVTGFVEEQVQQCNSQRNNPLNAESNILLSVTNVVGCWCM